MNKDDIDVEDHKRRSDVALETLEERSEDLELWLLL